ncbi:MAG: hypothetical protein QM654_11400 [Dysgonamonadaceae bacterium]
MQTEILGNNSSGFKTELPGNRFTEQTKLNNRIYPFAIIRSASGALFGSNCRQQYSFTPANRMEFYTVALHQ